MIYDVSIIGGGIVGLSTALKIMERKPSLKICIIEKEAEFGLHQTGSNSGVIHAGIYYKPGSQKALNCLRGYKYLLNFCNKNNIPYNLCGKLIVAVNEKEISALDGLYKRGIGNGLSGIRRLAKEEISEFEPHAAGVAAIHVPYTGIINFRKVCLKISEILIKGYGINFFFDTRVTGINIYGQNSVIQTNSNTIETRLIVNTAGLYSDRIALMTVNNPGVRIIPFRGEYYKIRPEKEYLVRGLIYPVPDPGFPFLGVHFTRMIEGGVEAGPNAVLAFKREGYKKTDISLYDIWLAFSWPGFRKVIMRYTKMGLNEYYRSFSKTAFTNALKRMVPEINKEDLTEGGTGVRAQACDRKGNLLDDFLFAENEYAINVLNAPSPAATASLSIGEHIAEKVVLRFT